MAYNKSPFKMAGKSPLMKQLLGNQGKLPMHLQEAIKASPAKQMKQDSTGTKDVMAKKEIKQDSTGAKDIFKGTPAKQMKQDSAGTKDIFTGKGSPAKKYGKSPAKKHGMSPLKQRNTDKNGDGKVNINELIPEGLNQANQLVQKGKKFVEGLGKISVFRRKTDEEKAAKAAAKALKKKQKADAKALKEKNKNK